MVVPSGRRVRKAAVVPGDDANAGRRKAGSSFFPAWSNIECEMERWESREEEVVEM